MVSLLSAPRSPHSAEQPSHSERLRERSPLDVALSVRIQETLRRSPYRRLHLVSTDVCDGVATLRGRVPNFHTKQIAQCLLADVPGLKRIDNRLHVAD